MQSNQLSDGVIIKIATTPVSVEFWSFACITSSVLTPAGGVGATVPHFPDTPSRGRGSPRFPTWEGWGLWGGMNGAEGRGRLRFGGRAAKL